MPGRDTCQIARHDQMFAMARLLPDAAGGAGQGA
jgi:hypothetical protein